MSTKVGKYLKTFFFWRKYHKMNVISVTDGIHILTASQNLGIFKMRSFSFPNYESSNIYFDTTIEFDVKTLRQFVGVIAPSCRWINLRHRIYLIALFEMYCSNIHTCQSEKMWHYLQHRTLRWGITRAQDSKWMSGGGAGVSKSGCHTKKLQMHGFLASEQGKGHVVWIGGVSCPVSCPVSSGWYMNVGGGSTLMAWTCLATGRQYIHLHLGSETNYSILVTDKW